MAGALAIVGKHYQIYKRTRFGFLYVCLVGECPRNAKNAGKFEPHMLQHGFSGIDHVANERFLCTLKNRCGVRTPAKPRRQFAAKPKDFIDGLLLLDRRCDAGFWADKWNFELQECILTTCVKSTTVETWCHTLENHIRLQPNEWPSKELNPKLRLAIRALKGIFPTVLLVETDIVRSFMAPLRDQMIQSWIKHLEWLRANLIWLENCSPHRIAERARPARLDDIVYDTDSQKNIVLDSGDVSEESVSHGHVIIPVPGNYIVSLCHDESGKHDNADDLLPTPEKRMVPAVTSDDEAFQRRLRTIYVSEDGVASHTEGLWSTEATDLLVSQVVHDMRTTFASFFPEQSQRT
ncbi:hypothetical protein R1sor_015398 [Riccia sorocarpa]|uniref:Uncharacterized protein n=1 Tax=Riccia sorocarpa TaxID=122646 RepID=A0ABD3HIB3_9MARC